MTSSSTFVVSFFSVRKHQTKFVPTNQTFSVQWQDQDEYRKKLILMNEMRYFPFNLLTSTKCHSYSLLWSINSAFTCISQLNLVSNCQMIYSRRSTLTLSNDNWMFNTLGSVNVECCHVDNRSRIIGNDSVLFLSGLYAI